MNCELKVLVTWLKANKLSLNESKTELIIFRPTQKHLVIYPNIILNKVKLIPQKHVTYLGITIDEHLSWIKHIENLCNKLSRANGILSKLRHYISIQTSTSVYYSISTLT